MTNLVLLNVLLCGIGFLVGAYTFVKHLKTFNKLVKTPSADAWLVSVGTLGWSILLYASIDDPMISDISDIEMISRVLIFVYWVGTLLKVQKHCLRLRQRLKKS